MTNLMQYFVLATLAAGVLAAISVWSRREVWVKAIAIAVAALFIPLAYAGFTDLMSKPKPAHMEWRYGDLAEAMVIASTIREDEAIYLWLQIDGVEEPRAYALPWSRRVAEQLQDATREAESTQTELLAQFPFEPDQDEHEKLFYAMPQVLPPPKDPVPDSPLVYAQPNG